MDTLGIIHKDISDVLSESDTDTSIVVYLHELGVLDDGIGMIG